jgi:hypothetical protein
MAERLRAAEAEYRRAQAAVSPLDDSSRQRYAAARLELKTAEKAAQALVQGIQDGLRVGAVPPGDQPQAPDPDVNEGGSGLDR